jgi:SARP family transcriptional regulator, regulator of embCAB operon
LARLRIYLTGRISIEHGSNLLEERELSGRQGRLAFAFLVTERHAPVTRDRLMSIVWPDTAPREPDVALSAILSKLRTALKKVGLSTLGCVEVQSGTVQVRLPSDAWIDVEEAANFIDEGEGALRAGDARRAWSRANVVVTVARRPFLADEEAPWIEARRASLRSLLVRGLHGLSRISAMNGEPALAIQYAAEVVALEPFLETGYRHLMQLHAHMGNRAEALRVFGKCRELLREELGADPSQETEALFLEILRAGQ